MSLAALGEAASEAGLALVAAVHDGSETVALLAPDGADFWAVFSESGEFADGAANPLDRWSERVIGRLAAVVGGEAVFPSQGPPYPPFVKWALRSGQCHVSPVGLLVHSEAGLWVSFRGAVVLAGRLPLPGAAANPCKTCKTRPCLAACPVGALGAEGYDVGSCHGWLDRPEGQACMAQGCATRRACPAGAGYGRLAAQSAFHMKAFHT